MAELGGGVVSLHMDCQHANRGTVPVGRSQVDGGSGGSPVPNTSPAGPPPSEAGQPNNRSKVAHQEVGECRERQR